MRLEPQSCKEIRAEEEHGSNQWGGESIPLAHPMTVTMKTLKGA